MQTVFQNPSSQPLARALRLAALLLLAGAMAAALIPTTAAAQEVQPKQVYQGRSGPFDVSVSVLPREPLEGTTHFIVQPLNADTAEPVEDAEIMLVAIDQHEGGSSFQAPALNSPSEPGDYHSNITFDSEGQWMIEVSIDSRSLGAEELSFPLDVMPSSSSPVPGGALVLIGVLAFLGGGTVYVWYSAHRAKIASRS